MHGQTPSLFEDVPKYGETEKLDLTASITTNLPIAVKLPCFPRSLCGPSWRQVYLGSYWTVLDREAWSPFLRGPKLPLKIVMLLQDCSGTLLV